MPVEQKILTKSRDFCLVQKKYKNFYCDICEEEFHEDKEVENHLSSAKHENARIRYGCQKIKSIRNNLYYCQCCDCKIHCSKNACQHVKGNQHSKCLTSPKKRDEKKKFVSKKRRLMEAAMKKKNKMLTTFLQMKKSSFEKVWCKFCHTIFHDISAADFHCHLAKHASVEIFRPEIDVNANVFPDSNSTKDDHAPIDTIDDQTIDEETSIISTEPYVIKNKSKKQRRKNRIAKLKEKLKRHIKSINMYKMEEKQRIFELSTKLCLIKKDCTSMYCLVCRKTIFSSAPKFIYEHFFSLDHSHKLEEIEQDHSLFREITDQYSELDLILEYMEEIEKGSVHCRLCKEDVEDVYSTLEKHINKKSHKKKHEIVDKKANAYFLNARSITACDWYRVLRYWCVPCCTIFDFEVDFILHLEDSCHLEKVEQQIEKKELIFDFCTPCGFLSYGFRTSLAYHCLTGGHKWMSNDQYMDTILTPIAKNFLIDVEKSVESVILELKEISVKEVEKETLLTGQLEACIRPYIEKVDICLIGSRSNKLALKNSNIDILLQLEVLDKENVHPKRQIDLNTMAIKKRVIRCLSANSQTWCIKEKFDDFLHVYHKQTGLDCNIFFRKGFLKKTSKLLKKINNMVPICQKMMLFIKQWMIHCDLAGSREIPHYAMYWFIIFFLQRESILPSMESLMKDTNTLLLMKDSMESDDLKLERLLQRFFTFYKDFDFHYNIICPLTGTEKKKFSDEASPDFDVYEEMSYYPSSTICILNPFDEKENLTKNVSKATLWRFQTFCSKSLDAMHHAVLK